ncbi:MAG: hypothetical protein Kow0068_23170 [Marinilabiliales bacterium]
MKNLILMLLVVFGIVSLYAQQNNPKVDIKVNKEYDENGNIIRYDSTYTYYYSTDGSTDNFYFADSLLNQFSRGFSFFEPDIDSLFFTDPFFNHSPLFNDPFFNDPFFNDPILNDPFFKSFHDYQKNILKQFFNNIDSLDIEKESYTKPQNTKIKGISL